MALVFRAAFLGRGMRVFAPKCSSIKINVNSLVHRQNEYSCKTSFTLSAALRRDYATLSEKKARIGKKEEPQQFDKKKTADGKEIVYEGMLNTKIRNIKFFSLSTSFLALSIQPMIYTNAVINGVASNWTLPIFGAFGVLALATPTLLHYITKRYILEVHYDPVKDTYTALIYNIFVKVKKIEFTPEDVTIPTILGMFTTCAIKGKPMFLDSEGFPDQKHYVRIMGYDKPLDLGLDKADIKKSTSVKKDSASNV